MTWSNSSKRRMKMQSLNIPLADETIRSLKVGDPVLLNGIMITGRDTVHKWMVDTFIKQPPQPQGDDLEVYAAIKPLLAGSVIYHCGPVVAGLDTQQYKFVAAGPTTSIREEPYQGMVMKHFNIKGVIGKGGMGSKTLEACTHLFKHTPRRCYKSYWSKHNISWITKRGDVMVASSILTLYAPIIEA